VQDALNARDLPELPQAEPVTNVRNAPDYAGTYTSPGGQRLVLRAENARLILDCNGHTMMLDKIGKDAFLCPHPDLNLFALRFYRDKAIVTEASFGAEWYTNERYDGPRHFTYPEEWNAYPGHYRTATRQHVNFRIVLRKGKLWLVNPGGDETSLAPKESGLFQLGDAPEWLRFDTILDGKALRVNYSGTDFHRDFTP
jgi:hypothetical protein